MGSERGLPCPLFLGAARGYRGRADLTMAREGALAINPETPRGPFPGFQPWLISLVWEEADFWRKLWVPSPPPSLPTNRPFLFTTPVPRGQRLLIPTRDLRVWSCRLGGNSSPASPVGTRMLSWSPPGAHVTRVQL